MTHAQQLKHDRAVARAVENHNLRVMNDQYITHNAAAMSALMMHHAMGGMHPMAHPGAHLGMHPGGMGHMATGGMQHPAGHH
jgi:hypothetical protein